MMSPARKVVTVLLAAKEGGQPAVSHPLLHALIYSLKRRDITFPTYLFNPRIYPVEFQEQSQSKRENCQILYSIELDDDLANLTSTGYVEERSSVIRYLPGDRALKLQQYLVEEFQADAKLSFEQLTKTVSQSLAQPRAFLADCYQRYIRNPVAF